MLGKRLTGGAVMVGRLLVSVVYGKTMKVVCGG